MTRVIKPGAVSDDAVRSAYDIDPIVANVASDPRYFTYLSGASTRPSIVRPLW